MNFIKKKPAGTCSGRFFQHLKRLLQREQMRFIWVVRSLVPERMHIIFPERI